MADIGTRQTLSRIAEVESDLREARRVRREILASGSSSASISSGGGSKSFTRLDLDKVSALIAELTRELQALRAMLAGGGGLGIGRIMTVRC